MRLKMYFERKQLMYAMHKKTLYFSYNIAIHLAETARLDQKKKERKKTIIAPQKEATNAPENETTL